MINFSPDFSLFKLKEISYFIVQFSIPSFILNPPTISLLYSAALNGFSIRQMEHFLIGYPGCTLMHISVYSELLKKSLSFAIFMEEKWKTSKNYIGNSNTKLYMLEPWIEVYRVTGSALNCVLWSETLGGSPKSPRFSLSFDLQSGFFNNSSCKDNTFESSNFLDSDIAFMVDDIEVYGFSGEIGLQAWKREKILIKKFLNKDKM